REQTDLTIHGEVSPSLLRNLEEFQVAWNCWLPEQYARIEITADCEREEPEINLPNDAVAAFSGGVDSAFTIFRHRKGLCGRLRRDVRAAIMIQGFDIPLNQAYMFQRALNRSERILASLGVELIPVSTNLRELGLNWGHSFGAAMAACLTLFKGGYRAGLLGSSEPYCSLVLPWGSNPVTDSLLSSDSFQIIHDGAGFTRTDKVRMIANWSEAMLFLRVCWEGERLDRNCGQCEKCIRTMLNFRVNSISLPQSFERDVSDREIREVSGLNRPQLAELRQILAAAKRASVRESWVAALDRCIKRNDRRLGLEAIFERPALRKFHRVVPWRVRSFLSRYREERSPVPKKKIYILKDESGDLLALLKQTLIVADSPRCTKLVARVEQDKRKTVKALGNVPADPTPLPATRYGTEAEALAGCATPKLGGKLLFAVTSVLKPSRVIEIGAAHGYGALYIGSALRINATGKLLTLEGMAVRVKLSRAAIQRFGLEDRVEVIDGDFRLTFARALQMAKPVDLFFFDGDKDPENTRVQFAAALNAMDGGGYFMFDDINFDDEMRRFWSDVLQLERVSGGVSFYDRWGLIRVKPSPESRVK
ncbi:MAG: O-methyltransferase, partial [Candidatus Binatia bacterium]